MSSALLIAGENVYIYIYVYILKYFIYLFICLFVYFAMLGLSCGMRDPLLRHAGFSLVVV